MSRLVTLEGEEMGFSFKKLKKGIRKVSKKVTAAPRFALKTAGKVIRKTAKVGLNYTPHGFVIKNIAKGAGIYPKKRTATRPAQAPRPAMTPAMNSILQNLRDRAARARVDQQAYPEDSMPGGYDQPQQSFDEDMPMPGGYDQPQQSFDEDMPMPGGYDQPEDDMQDQEGEMQEFPYMYGDADLTSTTGTTADAQPSEAAPTAKKKKKKKGAWSKVKHAGTKVKGAAKWTGKKIVKGGKAIGSLVLSGLDSIVIGVVKDEIKRDGGVIRPDLKSRCVKKIQAAAATQGIPAPGAIVGKMVDRAIKKLSGKYSAEDYAEDAKDWISEHKALVGGGVLAVAFLIWSSRRKRGRRG